MNIAKLIAKGLTDDEIVALTGKMYSELRQHAISKKLSKGARLELKGSTLPTHELAKLYNTSLPQVYWAQNLQKNAIAYLLARGYTKKEIANEFSVTASYISQLTEPVQKQNKGVSSETLAIIKGAYHKGYSVESLAKTYKVSPSSIYARIK